jgi:hypothetical protein
MWTKIDQLQITTSPAWLLNDEKIKVLIVQWQLLQVLVMCLGEVLAMLRSECLKKTIPKDELPVTDNA